MNAHLKPILDHVVINVAADLDPATELYGRLGFTLTERGHHMLGSSNNLANFRTNYLELLGFLPGRADSVRISGPIRSALAAWFSSRSTRTSSTAR